MGIENVKRWQWVAISLAVGPLLAFMNSQAEPGAGLRSLSSPEFEREIALKEVPGENPNLKNVVVHPPQVGAYQKPVYVVTMDRAVYDRADKGWRYQNYALQAEVPYVSYSAGRRGSGPALPASSDRTVLSALNDIKAKSPTVQFKYAWWEEPKWSYFLWTAGSVAAIGGAWPVVVALLIGAGLGPKPKEEEYDLDRFGKSEPAGESSAAAEAPREMSDADRAKLHTQLDELEKNIGSAAVMTDVPAPVAATGAPAAVRQLTGTAAEQQAALDKEREDKEYKGEFYPVAKTGPAKPTEPASRH